MLNTVGRLWATIHHKKGTITQYVAVRNALMPGVVCSKPTVCVQNARKSAKPSTVPASTILPLNALRTRFHRIAISTMPANRNRNPSSHAGGITATTPFMDTKL